jgi:hypothetical protein
MRKILHYIRLLATTEHCVRFQAPKTVNMLVTVSWDVAPYSLVETGQGFGGAYYLHHQGDHSNDGSRKHLQNVGQFLRDYMLQHTRRQSSSLILFIPKRIRDYHVVVTETSRYGTDWNHHSTSVGKPEGKEPLHRTRHS